MGGGTSKFDVTNWARANGELQSSRDTIDGSPPVREYNVITLQKRGMNQREFDIIDEKKNLLYTTKAVPGTLAWFDVLGPRSCGSYEDLILRVQVDLTRRTWMVYRYNTPVFEGQRPASLNPLLFKTACITVSWSRYVAVAARYGQPSIEYLFHLDPDKGSTSGSDASESQSLQEEQDSTKDEDRSQERLRTMSADSHDELFSAATSLAARRREEGLQATTNVDDDASPSSCTPNDNISRSFRAKQALANAVTSCSPGCRSTKYENQSPETTWHDPSTFDHVASTSVAASDETTSFNTSTSHWLSREARRTAAYQIAMQGVINLDGPLIECQEIYNKIIGNHQTTLITKDQVRRLLQWDEAQHSKLLDEKDTTTTTSSSIMETSNPFIEAVHDACHRNASPQPVFERIPTESQPTASHAHDLDGISEEKKTNEPLQSPHSTTSSPVLSPAPSRNEFEASLANIVAKQQKKGNNNPLMSWLNIWGSSSTRSLGSAMASPESPPRQACPTSEIGVPVPSISPAMQPLSPKQKSELPNLVDEDDANPKKGENDKTKSSSSNLLSSTFQQLPMEQEPKEPLIGYWSWKNSYTVHKIEMHLAKNTDLALHVVMAILCNQVRSERNAVAMTV